MKVNHSKIYIALGSNLRSFSFNSAKLFFNSVIFKLRSIGIQVKKKSSIWRSKAIPISCGPVFYNVVLECSLSFFCQLTPQQLLLKIEIIEKSFGKKLKGINKQRVIDIDLIDFHGKIVNQNILLPHPRMHLRKFVLFPLRELDKYWHHPKKKKDILFLISKIKDKQCLKKAK